MADGEDDPRAFHIDEDAQRPVGPGHAQPPTSSFDPHRLDFGHHAGKTIEELAQTGRASCRERVLRLV